MGNRLTSSFKPFLLNLILIGRGDFSSGAELRRSRSVGKETLITERDERSIETFRKH